MSTAIPASDLLDRALVRTAAYRFLADALLYPRPGAIRRLQERALLPASLELWGGDAVAAAGPALRDVAARLAAGTDETLMTDFVATFGHTVPETYPPHETRYGSAHPFQEAQDLGDVAAFYGAFGLRVQAGTGERVDHIALELEFAGHLALKEAYARERGEEGNADLCLRSSRRFVEDHLGRWGPVFGDLLARKAPVAFFRELGTLLAALLRADAALLGVAPQPVQPEPVPLPPEPSPEAVDEEAPAEGPRGLCG